MENIFLALSPLQWSLSGVLLLTFLIQLRYYLGRYGRIPVYKQKISNKTTPPVSVIVVVDDSLYYVDEILPRLLSQDYGAYEVVVVDNGSSVEVVEAIQMLAARYSHLKSTRINPDPKFTHRRKLALTVGIKAAQYPNLIFTETGSYPTSNQWLSFMAKGFTTGEVVIGYTGIERGKGLTNRLIRCSRLMVSIRYLSSAIRGRAYKAVNTNMGFTSHLYFGNKGYNYLRLNTGDDDLFIQKIADKNNTSVILHPKATMRETHYGGLSRWFNERRFYSYTFKYYPFRVKAGIFTELASRTLFFAVAAAILILMIPYAWIGAVVLLVLRYLAVYFTVSRICVRLGEKGLLWAFIIHDFISPVTETLLSLSRRIRPSRGLWS